MCTRKRALLADVSFTEGAATLRESMAVCPSGAPNQVTTRQATTNATMWGAGQIGHCAVMTCWKCTLLAMEVKLLAVADAIYSLKPPMRHSKAV